MLWVCSVLAMLGLGGFTARTASERGRSRVAWVAISIVAAVAAFVGGGWLVQTALMRPGESSDGAILAGTAAGALAFYVGPLASMALVLGALWKLPERVPTVGGLRWAMDRLSSRDVPGGPCELAFDHGRLRVGDVALAPADVTELVADGECLRISWAEGSVTLMPSDRPRTPREKAKRSQALAKRLRQLLGPPPPPPAPTSAAPYR